MTIIKDKYYYLVSSLPFLQFGQKPGITKADFIDEAKKWISEKEYAFLVDADINNFSLSGEDNAFLHSWKSFEYSLREEAAFFRKAKKRGQDYKIRKDLESIFQDGSNPLETERKLLFLRWSFLESLETGHNFDIEFITGYFLKLQILERLMCFNKEKGQTVFDEKSQVEI